jgi:thiosulfate reductase cytochrome b subunit
MSKLYLYPGWLRIWHGVNAIMCILLIFSGLSMQYSDFERYILDFKTAVNIHNICGVILTFNYLIFFFGNLMTPNGKQYILFRKNFFVKLMQQTMYYSFGIFKNQDAPFPTTSENKFNPLQRLVYIIVGYIALIVVIITGWAYLFPEIVPTVIGNVSGLMLNDLLHITMGFFISIFLLIHIYFVTIGRNRLKNFASIVTGYHE